MDYAPVIIPTLCRYTHFRRCVESLSRCTHAKETELFIALDYPAKPSHWDGYNKIKEYLTMIDGFKKVVVHKRKTNYGSRRNYIEMRDYCYSLGYDRYIFSEDDNEFSPNFLDYINKGLVKYAEAPNINVICAYTPPVGHLESNKNIYVSYAYSAWGIGIWKAKELNKTREEVKHLLHSITNCWRIFNVEPRILYTLFRMMNKGDLYGDTFSTAYDILNNCYSIFPTVSKVRNWGYDGSGEHCDRQGTAKYVNQPIDTATTFDFDDIEIKETELKSVRKHASLSWKQWVKFPYQIVKFWLKQGVIYK